MEQVTSRTAITGEEALAILLGFVDLETLEQLDYVNSYGLGSLVDDFARGNAKVSKQFRACATALSEELRKGDRSVLKVDYALSNKTDIYITLDSFRPWAIGRLLPAKLPGGGQSIVSGGSPAPSGHTTKPERRQKKIDQQMDAILAELRGQGFDPMVLPARRSGEDWVKKAVRDVLDGRPPFEGGTTFDNAWEELRKRKLIAEVADPSPHKKSRGDTSGGG